DAKVYANIATDLESEVETLDKDLRELRDHGEELRVKQKELDEQLAETSGAEAEAERLKDIRMRLGGLEEEERSKQGERAEKLGTAWRDLVQKRIQDRLHVLRADRDKHIGALRSIEGIRQERATLA